MKKRYIIIFLTGLLLLCAIGGSNGDQSTVNTVQYNNTAPASDNITEEFTPTCDGTSTTTDCELDGISYETYIYHPAVAEKTHEETVTTYQEKVVSYCTLCNDGTYSPSCATGRGACSYHGGVAQWNAPVYRNVPVYTTETVVDTPAQEAYYEKVIK